MTMKRCPPRGILEVPRLVDRPPRALETLHHMTQIRLCVPHGHSIRISGELTWLIRAWFGCRVGLGVGFRGKQEVNGQPLPPLNHGSI